MLDLIKQFDDFTSQFKNPFFGAAFGVAGLGAGLQGARRVAHFALMYIKKNYVMTNEITFRSPAYPMVLNWLTHHQKSRKILQLSTVMQFHQDASGKINAEYNFVPSIGTHYIKFENKWMKVERERLPTSVDPTTGLPFEKINFTCIGTNPTVFARMIDHARSLEESKHEGTILTYEPRASSWEQFGEPQELRAIDTVILDKGVAETICDDLKEFLSSKDDYRKRGIPYRRGYLLHGPPGCGKTTLVNALAGMIGYSICTLNLGEATLADDRVKFLMNILPPKSILLLEDIDAAFLNREDHDINKVAYLGLGKLTLSGILNAIDGSASAKGRIIFMTTNYPERIDAALKRPGRVDHEAYIGYATDYQLAKAFEWFYFNVKSGQSFVEAVNAARATKKDLVELSMADVQSHFICFKRSPQDALDHVNELIDEVISRRTKSKPDNSLDSKVKLVQPKKRGKSLKAPKDT